MPALQTTIGRGVLSARPAAGTAGALYYATDTSVWYRDNGSSWDNQNPTAGSSGGVTNAGNAASLQVGTDAGKGAAGTAGRIWLASDTGNAYYDNGSSWIDVATVQWANLTGKPSTFAPSAHQTSHLSGGSDAIGGLAQSQVDVDATEASTNDSLVAGNLRTNMRRIRYQLAQLGTGAWNTLVAMVQLSPGSQQSGTINVSGEVQGSDFKPGGVTGATAAARYHAATATGHPTSGTWAVGDIVPDQTGTFWFCTVAGTPGTWVQVGGTGGGGGGSSTLAGDTDVSISSPHGGQVLGYSDALSKWVNQQMAGVAATQTSTQLGADVALTSANTYYDGPSITLSPGVWFLDGSVTILNGSGTNATHLTAKLWDGTTVIASDQTTQEPGWPSSLALGGIVTLSSTTTYKISAASTQTGGVIKAALPNNPAGNTASYLNAIQLSGNPVGQMAPAVRAYNNANISIPDGTFTAVTLNSTRLDQGTSVPQHSTSTNTSRLTCQQSGVYDISGTLEWADNTTTVARRILEIRINGSTPIARAESAIGGTGGSKYAASTLYSLSVGDYVEMYVYQTSGGGSLNILSTANCSPEFMMCRVDSGPGAVQPNTRVQLDYIATTDIAVGLSLPATTWTDLVSNLSFTVDDPNSVVEIAVSGLYLVGSTANVDFGIRLVIDSAGTAINKMCGGNRVPAAVYTNCLMGVDNVVVTGLSAGTHTVKLQINPSGSLLGYCQPASNPITYNFQLRVLERKQSSSPPSSTPAPAVRCHNSANISAANSANTTLTWDTTDFDQGTSTPQHSTSSNTSRITCQQAGIYQATAILSFAPNATGERYADILLNGATVVAASNVLTPGTSSDNAFVTVTGLYHLVVGDYIETRVNQFSGGSLNVATGSAFMMARIDSGGQGFVPIPMVKTSSYTLTNQDCMVVAGANSLTMTLPLASSRAPGLPVVIKNDNFTGTSIARSGSDTIDGGTTYSLSSAYASVTLVSDGVSVWRAI